MRPDVRPISSGKNSFTQPTGEVNNEISSQRNVRMTGVHVREEFLKLSRKTEIFFKFGFLALASRVVLSEDSPPSKKLEDKELPLFQLLHLTFEASFSFKKS